MGELSKIDSAALSEITKNGIGNIIKPLTQEIHLFDTFIAGTTHIEDKNVISSIKEGDELILVREDNKFDSNAIMVKNANKEKLGYIPEKDNIIFSRLMDAGKFLKAKVKSIDQKGSFTKIAIAIYLYDF